MSSESSRLATEQTSSQSAWAVLSIPQFRLYLVGQMVSLFGTGLQAVAIGWLTFRMTGSAFALGATFAVFSLTQCFFGYLGGMFADKIDRRKFLILIESCCLVQALLLAAMQCFGHFSLIVVLTLTAINGLLFALEYPARLAFTIDLVGRPHLVKGRALFGAIYYASAACGSGAAGLISWLCPQSGEGICFLGNALSFLFSIGVLLRIRASQQEHTSPIESNVTVAAKPSFSQCLRFTLSHSLILATFAQTTVLALFGTRLLRILPVYAEDILQGGALTNGILQAMWAVGQICGSLISIRITSSHRLMGWATICLLALPFPLTMFALSDWVFISSLACIIVSLLIHAHVGMCQSVLQHQSPHHIQGRLLGLRAMLVATVNIVADLLGNAATDHWGAVATTIGCAALCLFGSIVCCVFCTTGLRAQPTCAVEAA